MQLLSFNSKTIMAEKKTRHSFKNELKLHTATKLNLLKEFSKTNAAFDGVRVGSSGMGGSSLCHFEEYLKKKKIALLFKKGIMLKRTINFVGQFSIYIFAKVFEIHSEFLALIYK